MRRLLRPIGFLVCLAILAQWLSDKRRVSLASDEINASVAVVRHQIRELERQLAGEINEYYLSIDNADPPNELISRLRSDKVRPGSLFGSDPEAWHFVIWSIEPLPGRAFLIDAGHNNGPLSASLETYAVTYRNGQWVIDSVKGVWVA
jgi:hypothetical protein